MVAEYFGGATALKAAIDIFKGLKGASVEELRAVYTDIMEKLYEARIEQLQLAEKVAELEHQLREIDDFEERIAGYRRHELSLGFIAYVPKEGAGSEAPSESYCANCISDRKFSLLQGNVIRGAKIFSWKCPCCKAESAVVRPTAVKAFRQT